MKKRMIIFVCLLSSYTYTMQRGDEHQPILFSLLSCAQPVEIIPSLKQGDRIIFESEYLNRADIKKDRKIAYSALLLEGVRFFFENFCDISALQCAMAKKQQLGNFICEQKNNSCNVNSKTISVEAGKLEQKIVIPDIFAKNVCVTFKINFQNREQCEINDYLAIKLIGDLLNPPSNNDGEKVIDLRAFEKFIDENVIFQYK